MTVQPHLGRFPDRPRFAIESSYEVLSLPFTVRSPSRKIAEAVDYVYGEMRPTGAARSPLEIDIVPSPENPRRLEVLFDSRPVFNADRLGDLLHELDNELTIAIEHSLSQLYFVHAAALAAAGQVTLLVGESGSGKSTTAYALAASGLDYLSDELAPLDPLTGKVLPYPRAICLKRDPPRPLVLPETVLRTEWTLHVRPRLLAGRVLNQPLPLARIVFIRYSRENRWAELRPLTRGEATLKLYQSALNQLAHPNLGLDRTLDFVQRAECFELLSAGIEDTVEVLSRS